MKIIVLRNGTRIKVPNDVVEALVSKIENRCTHEELYTIYVEEEIFLVIDPTDISCIISHASVI